MQNRTISSRGRCASKFLMAAAACALAPMAAHASLYQDNFDTSASSANYNIFQTTTTASANTGSVGFAYNYSALGIPQAPNSLGDTGTTGVWIQSDQIAATASATVLGAISIATKSSAFALPSTYKLSVEVWGNYIGGTTIADTGGSNSSTGATIGVQTAGTTYDGAITNATEGGLVVDSIRDATASGGTYRAYINGVNQGNTNNNYSIYAASGGSNLATTAQMYTNSYYTSAFPAQTAPTVQSSAASTQTGTMPAGAFGFAWHNETVTQDGTNLTWAIDGTTIATVPDSSITTLTGSALSLGDQDSNTSVGPATYNADIFDDLTVSALPEPASLSFLGIAGLAMIRRRRQA